MLAAGTTAVSLADFQHVPVDSPLGLRLGYFYLLQDDSAVESARARIDIVGFARAGKVFDAALQRDSGSAYRWCDKGELLLHDGNPDQSAYCYKRAGELAPNDVRILLDLGDYYSTVGKIDLALRDFSQILRQTGAPPQDILTANVFGYYRSMKVIENHLLDQAIPDIPNASAFFQFIRQTGDAAALRELWNWTCGKGFDTDPIAVEYAGFMVGKQQYEAAAEGWARHFTARKDGYPQSTLIFNGGFEYESTNGVFDWQWGSFEGIRGSRDRQIRQSGEYSYRMDFDGNKNLNLRDRRQTVYARPGRYRFEGWMRTSKITSGEGIRFRIRTSRDNSPFAIETPALTGTNDWTLLEASVEVPPGVPLLQVDIARRPSLRIDNQLNGTVWIDSVRLTPR
jgi:tetratricopeptide (TPR) repeat protein